MPLPAHNFLGCLSPLREPKLELKNFFVQDDQGNKLPGATCYLYQRGTENQAIGLQKANGVALQNPFISDDNGLVQFAAPNGLYDLRTTTSNRDFRIQLQFNDVAEDLQAANTAADRAENARDVAQLSASIYPTVDLGLAATGFGGYFKVLSPQSSEYLILYRNDDGIPVELKRYPSADAVDAVSSLVKSVGSQGTESEYLHLRDEEGGQIALLTDKRLETVGFTVSSSDSESFIGDAEGGAIFHTDERGTIVGHLEVLVTDAPGFFVVDNDGAVLNDLGSPLLENTSQDSFVNPLEGNLLFNPLIVTGDNADSFIHVEGILPRRELGNCVIATLSSTTTSDSARGLVLPISKKKFGDQAVLNLRAVGVADSRRFMTLNLKGVPVQSPPRTFKILMIGDSITNYQGAYLLKQYLEALGCTPVFLGTMPGIGDNGDNGPLGEGRHGWQARDFTYALSRKGVVAAGGEAAYLASSKSQKLGINPFLRKAVAGDSSSLVRNGYVFDPAFYQSRFSLDTPDIIVSTLGTNDANNISAALMYSETMDADRIMHSQILSAWPSAKILRAIPGTAFDSVRNALWTNNFTKVIAGMQQSAKDLGSRVTVAPLWAMTSPDGGYAVSANPADSDGFVTGTWSDDIHPVGSSRCGYYQAMAPYVAAQALNII